MFRNVRAWIPTVVGLMIAQALFAPAPCSGAEPEEIPRPVSSLQVFEALDTQMQASIADASLPPGVAEAVDEVRFDLKKDLIRGDAEIEVLKLQVGRFGGKERERALDELVLAAASRERRICVAIRQLEQIAEPSENLSMALLTAALARVGEEEKQRDEKRKEPAFGIAFEAEDSIDDPDP